MESVTVSLDLAIRDAAEVIAKALRYGGHVYWCGNGGSMAQAQHLAAEGLGIALDNPAVITAIANDYGFEFVFSRQLRGSSFDVLVVLSTSGNSPNVIQAVKKAKQMGMTTIALTGEGGSLRNLVDYPICVASTNTQTIQEETLRIGHLIMEKCAEVR